MSYVSYRISVADDFSFFRDRLIAYLYPFASEGKVVSQNDVMQFFEERREAGEVASKMTEH
jgi:hypothetical protein